MAGELPVGLRGKGDETCQEVYGKRRCSMATMESFQRFTGKDMLRGCHRKMPGGLRGKGDETCQEVSLSASAQFLSGPAQATT
jgi:hypothetical protein